VSFSTMNKEGELVSIVEMAAEDHGCRRCDPRVEWRAPACSVSNSLLTQNPWHRLSNQQPKPPLFCSSHEPSRRSAHLRLHCSRQLNRSKAF
jgi:hypothetical protein